MKQPPNATPELKSGSRDYDSGREAERLRALHEAGVTLISSLDLEEVLQRVSDLSRTLLDAHYAALGVFNEAGHLRLFITSGIDPHRRAAIGHLPQGLGLLGYLMRKGEPINVEDMAAHPESVGFPPNHPPMKTLLGIPLLYKGELLGDLYVTEKANGLPFDEKDEELLLRFGAQAAATLANAQLAQRLEAMAVVEERQRFAMDLHDSIIQDIYAIGLTLQAATYQVEASPQEAMERLQSSVRGLDAVIKELRHYITNLGPGRFGGKSLSLGLADLAREIRMSGTLQVALDIDETVDESLSVAQIQALFHVTREALSNILKHAQAAHADVVVRIDAPDRIVLEITDSGTGFSLPAEGLPATHHGLRNMRRRVAAVDGSLDVTSAPGQGTTVRVSVPVAGSAMTPTPELSHTPRSSDDR